MTLLSKSYQTTPPKYTLGGVFFYKCDSIDKPSSVVYDHLSSRTVACAVKPP